MPTGDQAAAGRGAAQLHEQVRAVGRPVPDDELADSDLILPEADATLDEVRALLSGSTRAWSPTAEPLPGPAGPGYVDRDAGSVRFGRPGHPVRPRGGGHVEGGRSGPPSAQEKQPRSLGSSAVPRRPRPRGRTAGRAPRRTRPRLRRRCRSRPGPRPRGRPTPVGRRGTRRRRCVRREHPGVGLGHDQRRPVGRDGHPVREGEVVRHHLRRAVGARQGDETGRELSPELVVDVVHVRVPAAVDHDVVPGVSRRPPRSAYAVSVPSGSRSPALLGHRQQPAVRSRSRQNGMPRSTERPAGAVGSRGRRSLRCPSRRRPADRRASAGIPPAPGRAGRYGTQPRRLLRWSPY